MASQTSLDILAKTDEALQDIQLKLRPFLEILARAARSSSSSANNISNDVPDAHRIALARTAVALSLGTLRYMGNRLRGSSQGKNPKDPLRLELNHMRQTLLQVQKKLQQHQQQKSSSSSSPFSATTRTTATKRKIEQADIIADRVENKHKSATTKPVSPKRLKA